MFQKQFKIKEHNLSNTEEEEYVIQLKSGFNYLNSLFANPNIGRFNISNDHFSLLKKYYEYNIGQITINLDPIELNFLLDSLLFNLVQNSIDHGFPKGIPVKNREINIIGKHTNNGYEIVYEDNGIGMKQEQLKNVFIEGKTTKKGNSEIAMFTWKQKIQIHGGDISAESSPGMGAKFIITIPKDGIFVIIQPTEN